MFNVDHSILLLNLTDLFILDHRNTFEHLDMQMYERELNKYFKMDSG